jgi:hypothetical protein
VTLAKKWGLGVGVAVVAEQLEVVELVASAGCERCSVVDL